MQSIVNSLSIGEGVIHHLPVLPHRYAYQLHPINGQLRSYHFRSPGMTLVAPLGGVLEGGRTPPPPC